MYEQTDFQGIKPEWSNKIFTIYYSSLKLPLLHYCGYKNFFVHYFSKEGNVFILLLLIKWGHYSIILPDGSCDITRIFHAIFWVVLAWKVYTVNSYFTEFLPNCISRISTSLGGTLRIPFKSHSFSYTRLLDTPWLLNSFTNKCSPVLQWRVLFHSPQECHSAINLALNIQKRNVLWPA